MSSIFPLGDLKDLLLIKIVKKMTPTAFVRFRRTNKKIYGLCNSEENLIRIPLQRIQINSDSEFGPDISYTLFIGPGKFSMKYVELDLMTELPFSIKCYDLSLHELIKNNRKFIDEFVEVIRKRQIICDYFCYAGDFTGREAELKWCIEATRPTEILLTDTEDDEYEEWCGFVPSRHFPMSLFKDMRLFHIDYSDYTDQDLIVLKAENIRMRRSKLTSWGVNQVIQQWFSSEREIVDIHLMNLESVSEEEIVKDLPVCLVYNKDWHKYSLISYIDITKRRPLSKYQLIRPGDFDSMLTLDIYISPNRNYIQIRRRGFPTDYEGSFFPIF